MSYFKNGKIVAFVTKAFANAGLDIETVFAKGDEAFLKSALEAAAAKTDSESAAALEAATSENNALGAKLAEADKRNAELAAKASFADSLVAALDKAGIKASDAKDDKGAFSAEKFAEAFSLVVAKESRIALAKAGHKAVDDKPVAGPVDKKPEPAATGSQRVRKAIDRDLARIHQRDIGNN